MDKSETIGKLIEALAKAQSAFPSIPKSNKVDFTTKAGSKIKYSYTPLEEIIAAVRKPLSENGLAFTQLIATIEGKTSIETVLGHISGEWIAGEYAVIGQAANPQEMGSLITYGRRYALIAILGISTDEDTDAQDLLEGQKQPAKKQEKGGSKEKQGDTTNKQADPPESTPQNATGGKEHWCPTHNCAYFRQEKEGKVWYSHKADGKWCNEKKKGDDLPIKPELIPEDDPWKPVYALARERGITKKDTLLEALSVSSLQEITPEAAMGIIGSMPLL